MWANAGGTTGGGSTEALGLPTDVVTGIEIKIKDSEIWLKWTDPEDKVMPDGTPVATWKGTKLVYKQGKYPENRFDGVQLLDNTVRNQYKDKWFKITQLENGTTYYFSLFPYTDTGLYNDDKSQRIEGAPVAHPPYMEYGVRIDKKNSNPETSCTYIGDAETGVVAGDFKNTWRKTPIFKDIKPCVLKNGIVQYYLNRDNLTLKEDGTPSKLSEDGIDVMVEVPKIGYKFVNTEQFIEVWVTNNPNVEGYCYKAHSLKTEGDCDKIYYGAFLTNTKLHSWSVGTIDRDTTLDGGRYKANSFNTTEVKKIGEYQQFSYYPMILLQCLYLIQYKNLDSQEALGMGCADRDTGTSPGTTVKKPGENYASRSGYDNMKFMNIEDMWGNALYWVDGVCVDDSMNIKTDFKNFNDRLGYRYSTPAGVQEDINKGFINEIQGTNDGGFIVKENKGSETTYFSDVGSLYRNGFGVFGGRNSSKKQTGAFCFVAVTYDSSRFAYRLMFKHLEEV